MKKQITFFIIIMFLICFNTIVFAVEGNQYIQSTKIRVDNYNNEKIIYGFNLQNNQISIKNVQEERYFKDNIEIKAYDINGNEILDINKGMGTGSKIKLYQDGNIVSEYTVLIYGDVSGDGKITPIDALALIKAINKKIDYINPICQEAGKITNKEKNNPAAIDALALIKHLNGKYEIKQSKEIFIWDSTSDESKENVVNNILKFKVIALDEEGNEIQDISWSVSEGTLDKENGIEVTWTIPEIENIYKITATLSNGRVLEKEIRYLDLSTIGNEEELETKQIEINENDDEDSDGLTNKEEKELGTDIFYNDSDADGLNDYEEVKEYNTNPLLKDTDGDEIDDLNEIKMRMNPLEKDSDGDGILDSEESTVYVAKNEEIGVKIAVEGNANIVDTQISSVEVEDLKFIEAIVSPVYDFNTSGKIESANVYINYDEAVLNDRKIEENNLSLYYFDPINFTFDEVETIIDTENNIASATLEHFSMYILADKHEMISKLNNQIMFVIDNSASMYTYEQAIEKNKNHNATTEDLEKTPANDPYYKRLDVVSYLINKLDDDFEYGLSKFTGTSTVLNNVGASKEEIRESLEKIKSEGEIFNGTYIGSSLYTTSYYFSSDRTSGKYIVLISDGEDNAPSSGIIKDTAIKILKEKGIRVIAIGLGNEVNKEELREYASETGGVYYHVDNANMLNALCNNLLGRLNFGRTTIENENGENEDYLVVADSGFIPENNGFAFPNYATSRCDGQCYGMAEFSKQFYNNTLNPTGNVTRKFNGETINFNYDISSINVITEYTDLVNYKFENKAFEKLISSTNRERLNYDKLEKDFNDGVDDLHIELKEEYKQYVEQTNGVIKIRKKTGTKEGYGTVTYDFLYIDMNSCTEENIKNFPDLQLFKAIEFLYMNQLNSEGTYADNNKVIMFDNISVLDETIDKINNGIPVIIAYQTYEEKFENTLQRLLLQANHAVNGIKVLRNIKDTNKYKIAIYNNQNPKETQYLNVEKVQNLFGTTLYCSEQGGNCTNIFVEK